MNEKELINAINQRWGERLDKIRAEIIARDKKIKNIRSDSCCFFTADEILNILDKYRESEGKE